MPEHEDMASEDEMRAAHDPRIGAGTPQSAPYLAPDLSQFDKFPARTIALIIAAIDAGVISADMLPAWATALAVAIVTLAGALGIQAKVTPTANPKLDDATPLIPAPPLDIQ